MKSGNAATAGQRQTCWLNLPHFHWLLHRNHSREDGTAVEKRHRTVRASSTPMLDSDLCGPLQTKAASIIENSQDKLGKSGMSGVSFRSY